ncbi:MAG: hypothetical protein ABIS36_20195 [Chryseolinea sp.]
MEDNRKELKQEFKKLYKAFKATEFKVSGGDVKLTMKEHETMQNIVDSIERLRKAIKEAKPKTE